MSAKLITVPSPSDSQRRSDSGATSAYRGYRLQALYTLNRILDQRANTDEIFQPEGREDLAIFDGNQRLKEIIQIKQRAQMVTLSTFAPEQADSFFNRVARELTNEPTLGISIVAFGDVGPELVKALKQAGPDRTNVATKIATYGHLSQSEAIAVLERTELIPQEEPQLTATLLSRLGNSLPGVDPDSAFEMLMYWLYICSEEKRKVTRNDVIDRINRVGQFVAARAAYHHEWFVSILPIEDQVIDEANQLAELANEFYQGISARYEHILADLDVIRPEKLQAIATAFGKKRVVILHAASGQGKSTLCFRYLREYFPQQWRFRVQSVATQEQALRVALAVTAHADAIDVPLVVYVDVSADDRDWPKLVKRLSEHRNIRVLVSIREEDWRRANLAGTDFQFETIELFFDEDEAKRIYLALTTRVTPVNLLDFAEAWQKFGGEGPLMEFIYLVAQGDSLRERLRQQVTRLEDEVREGKMNVSELFLLRLTSVASAFESKLKLRPLVEFLRIAAPQRTLDLFEKEYLLRVSDGGSSIGGLHPIRSTILSELLCNEPLSPWSESASACLPFLLESDIENFLLYCFSRKRSDVGKVLPSVNSHQPVTWTGIGGVLRPLIWLGVAEYVDSNRDLIKDAAAYIGSGWAFFVDFDLTGYTSAAVTNWWMNIQEIPESEKEKLRKLQERQTDKKQIFAGATEWLRKRTERPAPPETEADWSAFAETVFWVKRLNIEWPVPQWISDEQLNSAIESLTLEVLGDVVVALDASGERFAEWLDLARHKWIERLQKETLTVVLEDDGKTATTHFIFDMTPNESASEVQGEETSRNKFHWEAMRRIGLLRKLLPSRESFGSQGYGHLLWENFLPHDESSKTQVPRSSLPLLWLTSINAIFGGLGNQVFRPVTWRDYAESIWSLRKTAVASLKQLADALEVYFRRQQASALFEFGVDEESWNNATRTLNNPPLLPRSAVDEWGFVDESTAEDIIQARFDRFELTGRNGLILQKHKAHLKAFSEYTRSLTNFFSQASHGMALQPFLGRGRDKNKVLEKARELGIKPEVVRLATWNLSEGIKNLSQFHRTSKPIFEPYFTNREISDLEEQERKLFRDVWSVWFFFASRPEKVLQDAKAYSDGEAQNILRKIRLDLRQKLRRLSPSNMKIDIISGLLWDGKPALWLLVDTLDPSTVYLLLGQILTCVQQAVLNSPKKDFRRYILEFDWPYLVIVPLVRGKYINPQAWRISLSVLLGQDSTQGLGWWNLAQHPIPSDTLAELNKESWDLPKLELGTELLVSSVELFVLAAHVRDLNRIPDAEDELGKRILQDYIVHFSENLSRSLQTVLNNQTAILDAFNELSESEYESRPALLEAVQATIEMRRQILPTEDFENEAKLTQDEMTDWAERLQQAQLNALVASLAWVSDVLDHG
jgi:hypothetical protein